MRHRTTVNKPSVILALVIVILGALILIDIFDLYDIFNLLKVREIFND